MNKKDNILKKWWFNLIIVPSIMAVITIVSFFNNSMDKTSYGIMGWLIIFTIAMIMQVYLLITHKVKYRMEHYMFISVSVLLSIFVGFVISKMVLDNSEINFVTRNILQFISPPIVLVLFKSIIWMLLHFKTKGSINKDNQINELLSKVDSLEKENEELRAKLNPEEIEEPTKEKSKWLFWK